MSSKVWVIENQASPPAGVQPPATGRPRAKRAAPRAPARPHPLTRPLSSLGPDEARTSRSYGNWLPVLVTYVLGPLAVARWAPPRRRTAWLVVGAGGTSALVTALALREPLLERALPFNPETMPVAVTFAILLAAVVAAWGSAVAAVGAERPLRVPAWARSPATLLGLGLALPGAGLLVSGKPRRAGAAVACVLLGVVAAAVLAAGPQLWRRAGEGAGTIPLEWVALGCVATVLFAALVWVAQALAGAANVRAVGTAAANARRGSGRSVLSGLLLLALAAGWIAAPAAPLAKCVHRASTDLRGNGLVVAPWILCRVAARLDPSVPIYLADVAELSDTLGHTSRAREARETLRSRAADHRALPRELRYPAGTAHAVHGAVAPSASAWERMRALSR